ncbi:hypothetical protein [Pedobacter sp. Leaf194]|nr:hypothetical protein [Pedobacter sp. Leaf194]
MAPKINTKNGIAFYKEYIKHIAISAKMLIETKTTAENIAAKIIDRHYT